MTILNNALSVLMDQRLKWLGMRSQVLASNIANADNKATTRKELKAFKEVLANSPRKMTSSGQPLNSIRDMRLGENDILTTNTEIERETEMLEMAHNVLEHNGLINIVRNFHKMFRTVIGKK